MKPDYYKYQAFCYIARDDQGNKLLSELNKEDIVIWEQAIKDLAYEGQIGD